MALAVRNPDIKAAVPFYGPNPPLGEAPNTRAAILGVYGANDQFINPGIPAIEGALKQSNKTYKVVIYPDASHAFFNNTGFAYNAQAAASAWKETLDWFAKYLKG